MTVKAEFKPSRRGDVWRVYSLDECREMFEAFRRDLENAQANQADIGRVKALIAAQECRVWRLMCEIAENAGSANERQRLRILDTVKETSSIKEQRRRNRALVTRGKARSIPA